MTTFWTFCWSLLIGAVIMIIISIIFTLFISSLASSVISAKDGEDLASLANKGIFFIMFIPIIIITCNIFYMYYTFSKSYSYGWSDAEEKHGIPADRRFCYGKKWCEWDKMYT
jgi:hypothetical protein